MPLADVTPASTFEPIKFPLSAPIMTHKGEVNELTLKMVNAGTFVKYGMLYSEVTEGSGADRKTRFEFNFKAVMGFLQDATGHGQIILSAIPGNDMVPLAYRVLEMVSFDPKTKSK